MTDLSRKRPWVAVLLGTLVTGLGHAYLRRWRRALSWYALVVVVGAVFVPASALAAIQAGQVPALEGLAPVAAVAALSVVDAYRLARTANRRVAVYPDGDVASSTDCPSCGRPVDESLSFCHWCASPLDAAPDESDAGGDESGGRRVS